MSAARPPTDRASRSPATAVTPNLTVRFGDHLLQLSGGRAGLWPTGLDGEGPSALPAPGHQESDRSMTTTYRIVVGIDGSEDGIRALRWAVGQARQFGGTVEAVMVYDWPATEAAYLAGLGHDGERQRAEDLLADAVERVDRESVGVPIATQVLRGNAGAKLADVAVDADLLVVGSHGRGRLYHAVLGSVAEACVRMAECPVVVVPVPHSARVNATDRVISTR